MIYSISLVIATLLAISIIVLILLHRGRGADVGAAFGGSSASGTVFGARGATSFLGKTIAILSTLFIINSLFLAHIANRDFLSQSVVEQAEQGADAIEKQRAEQEALEEIMLEDDGTTPEVPN